MRKLVLLGAGIAAMVLIVAVSVFLVLGLLLRDPAEDLMRRAEELRETGQSTVLMRGGVEPESIEDTSGLDRMQMIEEAADLFGQAALIAPESPLAPKALFEMGFTYYVIILPKVPEGRRGEKRMMADEAFRRLIERYPESPLVLRSRRYLGEIYIENAEAPNAVDPAGEYLKALEQLEVVVAQTDNPGERQQIRFNMSLCYERLGRIEPAIRCLNEIIEIGLEGRYFENAHLMLARYHSEAGLHEMAVEQLRLLLQSNISFPTRQDAYFRLVESLLRLKRFDQARAALNQVQETSSNRALIEDYKDRIRRWSMES